MNHDQKRHQLNDTWAHYPNKSEEGNHDNDTFRPRFDPRNQSVPKMHDNSSEGFNHSHDEHEMNMDQRRPHLNDDHRPYPNKTDEFHDHNQSDRPRNGSIPFNPGFPGNESEHFNHTLREGLP